VNTWTEDALTGPLTDRDVLRQLRRLIELDGSLRRAAQELNVSAAYLSAVINKQRDIGPALLKALHLRKVVTFEALPIPDRMPRDRRRTLEDLRRPTIEERLKKAP
jgi:hypothetical protein